jgi:hypothetical protein
VADASQERAQRIAARQKVKGAISAMRAATRALASYESLDEADIIGTVRIPSEEREADYAADLLDMVRTATESCGASRAIEVIVTEVAISQSPSGTDEGADQHGRTEGFQRNGARSRA